MKRKTPGKIEKAERRDDVAADLDARYAEWRRGDLERAKLLYEIDRSAHFIFENCASLPEWGQRHGYSPAEARRFSAVGRALELKPELEERVLEGRLDLDAVVALGKILENPSLIKEGEDWLALAERLSTKELQDAVKARLVEARDGGPSSRMAVTMSSKVREKFERARQVASQKEGQILDEGQTIGVLSDHYLDSFDDDRKTPRKRRMPDTSGRPGRHVPASERRKARKRKGKCQVPG